MLREATIEIRYHNTSASDSGYALLKANVATGDTVEVRDLLEKIEAGEMTIGEMIEAIRDHHDLRARPSHDL